MVMTHRSLGREAALNAQQTCPWTRLPYFLEVSLMLVRKNIYIDIMLTLKFSPLLHVCKHYNYKYVDVCCLP